MDPSRVPSQSNELAMNLNWCCDEFREHLFQTGDRQDGLGILVVLRSRTPPIILLEYRRPNRTPAEPIAEAGIKLKFCPWCGLNLVERYQSVFRPSRPET